MINYKEIIDRVTLVGEVIEENKLYIGIKKKARHHNHLFLWSRSEK